MSVFLFFCACKCLYIYNSLSTASHNSNPFPFLLKESRKCHRGLDLLTVGTDNYKSLKLNICKEISEINYTTDQLVS